MRAGGDGEGIAERARGGKRARVDHAADSEIVEQRPAARPGGDGHAVGAGHARRGDRGAAEGHRFAHRQRFRSDADHVDVVAVAIAADVRHPVERQRRLRRRVSLARRKQRHPADEVRVRAELHGAQRVLVVRPHGQEVAAIARDRAVARCGSEAVQRGHAAKIALRVEHLQTDLAVVLGDEGEAVAVRGHGERQR